MNDSTHTQMPARNSDSLSRLRALFDAAIDIAADERPAWLLANVADANEREAVARLIAADHTDDGYLDTPAGAHAERLAAEDRYGEGLIGQRIGAFRIVRLLGKGGMAAVFLGERDGGGFRQQVAVKLLRRGLYSELEQRLFMRERQVLAKLTHPHIARLIDGGVTTAGIPYLVMEYVEGETITRHAAQQRLDAPARLDLIVAVCRAVDAAHRALVVHRDIKPSNILVTADGSAKLLDFGIAKLLDDDLESATVGVFTPDYAAPEQLQSGTITTATDVYALGVLMHELLLGVRPAAGARQRPSNTTGGIGGDTASAAAASPAALRTLLRGDLDNILLKALATEPDRRYASAGALADDVKRYLTGRPVAAHPPSRWYRARKFVHRHRGGVLSTAAFLLAVFAALGIAIWQGRVAREAAQRANAMRDFMIAAFAEAEPGAPRAGPPPITDVVEHALLEARGDARMNPAARSELLTRLGAVLTAQGKLDAARENLAWNYAETAREFGGTAPLTLEAGHELLATEVIAGEYSVARDRADALLAASRDDATAVRAALLLESATLASKQHELARATTESDAGLALMRRVGDDAQIAEALSSVGNVQLATGDVAAAVATYEELLGKRVAVLGPQHVKVATDRADLSRAYRRAGNLDRAEQNIDAALAIDAAVLPKDHWRHSNHLNALTMVLLQKRDYAAALVAATESLRIDRIAYGDDSAETANDLNSVGMLHAMLEEWGPAREPLHEALLRTETRFGGEHYESAVTRANYGVVLAMGGDRRAGEAELRHAIASLDASSEPDPDEQAATNEKLARVELAGGAFAAALAPIDRIDALLASMAEVDAYWNGRAQTLRATAALGLSKPAEARDLLASAAAALARSTTPDAVLSVEIPLLRADAARQLGDAAAAADFAKRGAALLATLRNPPARVRDLAARVGAAPDVAR